MCARCDEFVRLLEESRNITGGYVASTFPGGKPTLVDPSKQDEYHEEPTCKCKDVEEFLRSNTLGEYSGVSVECSLYGREFAIDETDRHVEPGYKKGKS